MSEKKIIQILNENGSIIESIDITDLKLDNFGSLKKFISSKINLENEKFECYLIDDLGNKILVDSENEYKKYKNIHLYKIKLIDELTLSKFNLIQ